MLRIIRLKDGFRFLYNRRTFLTHTSVSPCVSVGAPDLVFNTEKGISRVTDSTVFQPLPEVDIESSGDESSGDREVFHFSGPGGLRLDILFFEEDGRLCIEPTGASGDRSLFLRLDAEAEEAVYGCGETFGAFDLKGKRVEILVQEHLSGKAVTRRILQRVFHLREKPLPFEENGSYYVQPTFLSSKGYFCHVDSSSYGSFDFRHPDYSLLMWSDIPKRITIGTAESWTELMESLTGITGRQPRLPDWATSGIILGIQGGTDVCRKKLQVMHDAGTEVAGIWSQDWEGQRKTWFGTQLMWNWKADEQLYPGLRDFIKELGDTAFLGYANPYLAEDGDLYAEAKSKGLLVKDSSGSPCTIKSTSFPVGIVDLTNPEAREWFKGVLKNNLVNYGLSGWMADFGEYLPMDAVLHDGDAAEMHNLWPTLWTRLNREAVQESGTEDRIVYFNRAGFTGTATNSPLVWTGDQFTDFSTDYGLGCFIRALLSLGLSGVGCTHGDIGGYITFGPIRRTREIYLRWLELAAFTPVMRTHEGNKPEKNHQFDGDTETVRATAYFSRVHARLEPYIRSCLEDYYNHGSPVLRPVFFHYNNPAFLREDTMFLLGRDILVCPVLKKGAGSRKATIPEDNWIHLFTGKKQEPGRQTVKAPLGTPAVFFREQSKWADLFESVRDMA